MRKNLLLSIALMIALATSACAAADEVQEIQVDFEGTYVQPAPHNFELFLPNDWVIYEMEQTRFVAGDMNGERLLSLEVYQNSVGYTMDAMLSEMERDSSYQSVIPIFYGGIPFISYAYPAANQLGAITQSADGAYLYIFIFTPQEDAAMRRLALQIMASLRMLEE